MGKLHQNNRLIEEKSPYLLQHASNPVDWYPWGEEAFKRAFEEQKPIFLSIGYATCHWCHVMEKESFEDEEVAALLNEWFVAIKVDREERPDIDHIYMATCQMMTGSGGWPLTIIMTPSQQPFFAATYIPKASKYGRFGLLDLLPRIAAFWKTQQGEIQRITRELQKALQETAGEISGAGMTRTTIETAYESLTRQFDPNNGGFASAPKFPVPHTLSFLLRYWRRNGKPRALEMVEKTLIHMHSGGIFDHIGGGFHRYSTDARWFLPHFEKMLYDQALLTIAYSETYQATGRALHKSVAEEIIRYVLRDMTSQDGAFFSAEDADSEGKEGAFYVWSASELQTVLGEVDAEAFMKRYNCATEGNFHDEATGKQLSENILYLNDSFPSGTSDNENGNSLSQSKWNEMLQKLFQKREQRPHPLKDDKVLTDWNGLMIAALAKAGILCESALYIEAAEKAAQFVLTRMTVDQSRLFHRYREGVAEISGMIDDYAFFIWGLLELYEATFKVNYLRDAISYTESMITHFWDSANGGFFFSPDDGEQLLARSKEVYDGAAPSGNSVALLNLLRLARITNNEAWEANAVQITKSFSNRVNQHPAAHTHFMTGLDYALGPSFQVVIAGDTNAETTKNMITSIQKQFFPHAFILLLPSNKPDEITALHALAPITRNISPEATHTWAYVCDNQSCKLPTTEVHEVIRYLNEAQTI